MGLGSGLCCTDVCNEPQEEGILSGKDTHDLFDTTLTTFFHYEIHRNKINPLNIAVKHNEQMISFLELHIQSTQLAEELRKLLGHNIEVSNHENDLLFGLSVPVSEKLIVIIFAILKLGGTYMYLDPSYPSSVIFQILKEFRPVLIVQDEYHLLAPDRFQEIISGPKFITIQDLWDILERSLAFGKTPTQSDRTRTEKWKRDKIVDVINIHHSVPANERPALIILTTGLHETPRGVRLSHASIMNHIEWTWKNIPYVKNGTCCLNVPLTFVESVHQIFTPLLKGITLNIYDPSDYTNMITLVDNLEKDRVTRVSLTQVGIGKLLQECHILGRDEARIKLKYLKYILCRGEVLSFDMAKRFFTAFPVDGKTLIIMYGYTELTGDVVWDKFKSADDVLKRVVSGHLVLGKVIDNTKVYLMNLNRELAIMQEQGQVCVSGVALSMGYSNTRQKDYNFTDNPFDALTKYERLYLTGDFGRLVICKDRRIHLLLEGRGDSFLRHNGYEFVIEDIKDVLKQYEGVDHVNIFIFHHGKADQSVLAFVQPTPNYSETLTISKLVEYLKSKVPEFMVPVVRIVQEFPLLESGRLDRHQLLKDYLEGRNSGFDDWGMLNISNKDAIEAAKVLLEAMYKYCSIPVKLTIKNLSSSFYTLGGSSLNTVALVVYLNKSGFPITIQDFIGADSLEDLINLMENRRALEKFRQGDGKQQAETIKVQPLNPSKLGVDSRAPQLYTSKHMEVQFQRDVIAILSSAYVKNGDLERISMVTEEQFSEFLNLIWDKIIEQQMSFVMIRNSDSKIVGVCLCYDFFTDISTDLIPESIKPIMEFVHEIKGQAMVKLEETESANEIQDCLMMATGDLNPPERVRAITFMVREVIKRSISDGFKAVFFSCSNQLMRDLLLEVFLFRLVDDYVVNEFSDSGIRPFHLAPGTLTLSSLYKVTKESNQAS